MATLRIAAAFIGLAVAAPAVAQDAPRALTLDQAESIARESNAALKATRQKVDQMSSASRIMFSNFLPRVETRAYYMWNDNDQGILLPAGSLGNFPQLGGAFPSSSLHIAQGGQSLAFAFTTLAQPITHYFRIKEGLLATRADETGAEATLRKVEQEVTLGVLRAYAGALIAERSRDVARERVATDEERVSIQKSAVQSGTALGVAEREARLKWLQTRQDLLEREGEVEDRTYALVDALGLPANTKVTLSVPPPLDTKLDPVDSYVRMALDRNPEVLEARALVDKATHGVGAARAEYIPEVGLMGMHIFQNSMPFFPKSTFGLGLSGKITLLDFGARANNVRSSRAQLAQAQGNLAMVEGRVRGEVESAYRKVERSNELVSLAREGAGLRTEAARLRTMQSNAGFAVAVQGREAAVDRLEGDLDLLKAELGYRLSLAELQKAAGTLR